MRAGGGSHPLRLPVTSKSVPDSDTILTLISENNGLSLTLVAEAARQVGVSLESLGTGSERLWRSEVWGKVEI